ncbi:SDR family oxidoreductase [Cryptosporangium phraense]|uniref:SDR family oxidoreductase n=1 Tax=Cryptosporangium phraense TaxID=2593070 RepID=A0A545ATJ9_9ACTN|nr:SDR family NAD(P)-dependent oxidoreductase [Cryptosporangium phraense]TQS44668.1 SDR family oxidoreductase [Cryptosporangium phraense]
MASSGVAVVTGGGSGIGRAAGVALVAAGFGVVFAGRTEATLAESVALARSVPAQSAPARSASARASDAPPASDEASYAVLDVTDRGAVDGLFDGVVAAHGRVDLLVNSAGIFGAANPVAGTTDDDWDAAIAVNVTGSFAAARAAFRVMSAQEPRGGRIVNLGSVSAQVPRPHATPYTVSKHAITGLTRSLALEGRDLGIAVGQLDVGNAATAMTRGLQVGALQPDGSRRAEPAFDVGHVADTVVFLARLPLSVNVPFMTVMATAMPLLGRG